MPGQIRRGLIGDGNGHTRVSTDKALVFVRLDTIDGPVQMAIYDVTSPLTEDTPCWVQACADRPPLGWRIIAETLT